MKKVTLKTEKEALEQPQKSRTIPNMNCVKNWGQKGKGKIRNTSKL